MNGQEFLASLQSRGLRAWQANFAASFLEAGSAAFQLLAGPPGTGKMYASVAIAAELVSRGAKRILTLVPAPHCEAWKVRLAESQSGIPVVLVTRPVFREMEAAIPIGSSPWSADGIYVISQDLAKQNDLAAGIAAVEWDLVIGDEAQRFAAHQRAALLNRLSAANAVRRLILISGTPLTSLDSWLHSSPDQPVGFSSSLVITNWFGALRDWDGSIVDRAEVKLEAYLYKRGTDEVKCLSQFLGSFKALQARGDGADFFLQLLTQRASSSLFAFEESLQRLGHTLRSALVATKATIVDPIMRMSDQRDWAQGDFDAMIATATPMSDIEAQQACAQVDFDALAVYKRLPWADKSAALAIVNQCLEALESISIDEKLNAFKRLVQSIIDADPGGIPMICVISMYADTLTYLHTAIGELGLSLFKVTGTTDFTERQVTVERFVKEGGIILGTDVAISWEGIAMPQVTHVVHYDVPSNPVLFEQRRGRFDRFGRNKPLTMYVLQDESKTIPSETRLIELFAANRGAGTGDV